MQPSRIHHVGLPVSDLGRSVAWYAEALGLTLEPTAGVAGAVAFMVAPTGERLELLAVDPEPSAWDDPIAALRAGVPHTAWTVDDLDAAHARAVDAGGRSVWRPRDTPEPGLRIAFVADPDGNLVELLAARIVSVTEARLEDHGSGLAPVTDGWFVVNVRDAEWFSSETRGAACWFESEYGEPPIVFAQLGINVTILGPGRHTVYHAESDQEAFLVLSGECTLLVENEERRLRPWDFFHSAPWTEHAFVGAGETPCVILMAGTRSPGAQVRYPASKLAARYGASVEEETADPTEVYATAERFRRERPSYWARLPWA